MALKQAMARVAMAADLKEEKVAWESEGAAKNWVLELVMRMATIMMTRRKTTTKKKNEVEEREREREASAECRGKVCFGRAH